MHVSTAFNNLDQAEMKEEVYPLKVDPVKIMELLDCLDNETLKNVTSQYVTHTRSLQIRFRHSASLNLLIIAD